MERDPFFVQFLETESMNEVDLEIAKMLSYNIKYRKSSFIPIITNYSRSLSPSGIQLDKLTEFTTKEGYSMNLPTNTTASNTGSTFSIDLPET
jgi:hypothetical protein